MAEVPGGEGGGGGGRHQKKRAKKGSTRIDMTPMVDLAFLLLTFFILTTTMYKPSTLQLTFPVPPDDPNFKPPKVNNALTLLLTRKDAIYYYKGEFKPAETQLQKTDFSNIRKILVEENKATVERINALTKDLNAGKINEAAYDSLKNNAEKQKEALFCIIKPDKEARYRNVIDIVDEMDITGVGKYSVQDSLKTEEQVLLDQAKANL